MIDIWDSKYISREFLRRTIAELKLANTQVKNISDPIGKLIANSLEIENTLKILGFFQIPGSNQVLHNIQTLQDTARYALKDINKVNLEKSINDVNELFFKLDSLYKELDRKR